MCGFVGIVNKDQTPVPFDVLVGMVEKIKHRGPDDEGYLIDGPLGFYHKRLSIIDLVTGQQPMTYGPFSIVYNGEIYNYIELHDSLKKSGHAFRTTSDTEVILHMYEEFGPEFVSRLNGMFAFIIYDRRENRLMVARDHFGIKPLYYYSDRHRLLFASEIKAILAHPAVEVSPNYESVQEYLFFQYVLDEDTLFKGIYKLLPGHYFLIDLKTFQKKMVKYWEPDFTVDIYHTEEYFIWKLREYLEDAITIQLRSDVPVGAHLSGGIDSSIVTLLASRKYAGRLKTFTGAFREGPQFDEIPYAREVANACGAEMHEIFPTEKEFIEIFPRLIYYMDEPAAGPGIFPQYMVSRLASEEVKVVLGGQGGDEIFGGYTRYVIAYLEQALKGAIFETTDEGEHIVSLRSILPNLPFIREYVPMLRRFWERGLFEPMDKRYFRLIDRTESDRHILTDDFRVSLDESRIFSRFQKVFNHPNTLSYYNKMVHYDMVNNLPALLQVEDRVSMAVSLESRVPLLDQRIVDLVASMPPRMKFRGAEMKYILKRATRDLLPQKILERKDKMGFPVPLHIWAKNRVRKFFRDTLLSSRCRERGIFDSKEVERLIENQDAFSRKLWGAVNLELWFKIFIDGE
ncbi:MAG: asparagine synthase (glutamine-hydrolyzing) [Clostridiales bacterium]|nr:asparagine synthase (glutamine-hydrolyzing) [Clostridiales bacterium]